MSSHVTFLYISSKPSNIFLDSASFIIGFSFLIFCSSYQSVIIGKFQPVASFNHSLKTLVPMHKKIFTYFYYFLFKISFFNLLLKCSNVIGSVSQSSALYEITCPFFTASRWPCMCFFKIKFSVRRFT